MSMFNRLEIVPLEGEPFTVDVTPRVVLAFERKFDKSYATAMGELRFEYLFWTAHQAELMARNRPRVVEASFDAWVSTIDEVRLLSEEPDEGKAGAGTSAP